MTVYRSLQDYTSDEIAERISACEQVAERERAIGRHADAIGALNHARNLRTELHQRQLIRAGLHTGNDPVSRLLAQLTPRQCEEITAKALAATHACLLRGRRDASSVRRLCADLVEIYEDAKKSEADTDRASAP